MKAVFKQAQKCLSCFKKLIPVVALPQFSAEVVLNTGERNLVGSPQDSQCKVSIAATKNCLMFNPFYSEFWEFFNSKDEPACAH